MMKNPIIADQHSNRPKTFNQLTDCVEGEHMMTQDMISRTWNEVDFMGTNDVTSLDLSMIDDNGDQMHGVIPKKLIWKFEPLLREGGIYSLSKFNLGHEKKIFHPARNDSCLFFQWDTVVNTIDSTTVEIPRYKFTFTALKK